MNSKIKQLTIAALFAALACVATMIIKIPSPLKGYLNIGDCVVLLSGWLLPPFYGFLAAGIGSALADLFSGYMIYAAATFVIKGLMALVAYYVHTALNKKLPSLPSRLISARYTHRLCSGSDCRYIENGGRKAGRGRAYAHAHADARICLYAERNDG